MKKLFMFLAVAGLATFGASCSSDDSKNDDPVKKDLVLSGKTDVKEGDAVTFTVKVGDKAEAGTDLYVDGVKATNPHTFSKVGEYKVQAKKKDFNDSNVLTVKVSEKGGVDPEPGSKTLVLSVVGGNEVIVGQEVIFLVKDNEGNNVTGATIKNGATTVANPWTPTEAGTVKFVASKEGYENSNEVSVVVSEKQVPQGNVVTVEGNSNKIDSTRLYVNTNAQNSAILYSLDDGTKYLVYNLISFTGETSYSQTTMAVIMPAGATQVLWPQDVPASNVITLGVMYIENGDLLVETPQGEEVDASYVWGIKATQNTDGVLKYTVGSSVIDVQFDGEYEGLYALVQKSTVSAKKVMNFNALKGATRVVNTKIAK